MSRKVYKPGTLIFIPDDGVNNGLIGMIIYNDDRFRTATCYKIYWMDGTDTQYSVSNLECQISANRIQVIYET